MARSNSGKRRKQKGEPTLAFRLQYVALRAAGFALRVVPVEAASAVMGAALQTVMPLTSGHRKALDNLALALPELSEPERRHLAKRMWANLGRVSGEAFQIDRLIADDRRLVLPPDFERLAALSAEGAISATLHMGNWEIGGAIPRKAGLELAGVYQKLHNPFAEEYLKRIRAPAYPAGLYSKGPHLARHLIRLVRQGKAVGIVSDLREMRGIGVMFFGQPAFATPLPAMLARMSGRPIIAGAVVRTGGVRFRALVEEVPVPMTDDRESDIAAATQALHDVFERWIRAHPDQWMWTHRKWARSATRPLSVRDTLFPGREPQHRDAH